MRHHRFEYAMPAKASTAFDAFHYQFWRHRWDSLVDRTVVAGAAPCPSVGAVTENSGRGLLRGLSMRTQFVTYDPPRLAAAAMLGTSFPFVRWAASMRHRDLAAGGSVLVYTYTFAVGPKPLTWLMEPFVDWIFMRQTHKRFARLSHFLTSHAKDIEAWQQGLLTRE